MGKILTDKQGNVIAKLLQFVATDSQVDAAITSYLKENGISLAEGIDLKKMNEKVGENASAISGLKSSVSGLQQAQNNVLLQYKDHFLDGFENGYIDNTTGIDSSVAGYARCGFTKITTGKTILIINIPTGYQCSFYFYDASKKFQGATVWMSPNQGYSISESQEGWYVRAVIYKSTGSIDLQAINIILAGTAVTDILDELKQSINVPTTLGEQDLSTSEKLELNITKASLAEYCHPNNILIPFLTDLHITCTAGKSADELVENAAKIRRHIACYNAISEEYIPDICVYGGDYLNNSSQTNKQTAVESHKAVRKLMDMTLGETPVIVCKGNHDDNTMYTDYKNGYVDSETLYNLVTSKDTEKAKRNVGDLEKAYGYYDIPNKKVRVFALNSDDVPTALDEESNKLSYGGQNNAGFSQAQLQFVADSLKITEEGWQVIFFSHHPLMTFTKEDTEASGYSCSGVTVNHGGQALLEIIQAFVNKEKGTCNNTQQDFEVNVEYDFTRNKSNTVIASICGHTHVYCHKEVDGVHYIATRAVLGHPTYNYISTSTYIVIDRKNRVLHLIANGDGEDYNYNY